MTLCKKISSLLIVSSLVTFLFTACETDVENAENSIDVTGRWEGTILDEKTIWVLTQTGNTVTMNYGDFVDKNSLTSNISVEGKTLDFDVRWIKNGTDCSFSGAVTIDGETILGNVTFTKGSDTETGTISFTRTSASTAVPQFTIPGAAITVNGETSDWNSVSGFISDATGDSSVSGTDIKSIKIARDADNIYNLVELNSGNIPTTYLYEMVLNNGSYFINVSYTGSAWQVIDGGNGGAVIAGASVNVNGSCIELSVPKSFFNMSRFTLDSQILANVEGSETADNACFFGYVYFN